MTPPRGPVFDLSEETLHVNGRVAENALQIIASNLTLLVVLTREEVDAQFSLFWPRVQRKVAFGEQIQECESLWVERVHSLIHDGHVCSSKRFVTHLNHGFVIVK